MLRAILIHFSLMALMICCVSASPASTAQSSPEIQEQKLKDQLELEMAKNAQLRERIQDLQKQLQDMTTQMSQLQAQLKAPPATWAIPRPVVPRILPDGRPMPPSWNERQFNGLPVYIIPLQASATSQAAPAAH